MEIPSGMQPLAARLRLNSWITPGNNTWDHLELEPWTPSKPDQSVVKNWNRSFIEACFSPLCNHEKNLNVQKNCLPDTHRIEKRGRILQALAQNKQRIHLPPHTNPTSPAPPPANSTSTSLLCRTMKSSLTKSPFTISAWKMEKMRRALRSLYSILNLDWNCFLRHYCHYINYYYY